MPFQKGNPGKPKGARHTLGQNMVKELAIQFQKHGRRCVEDLAVNDPKAFLDVCVRVLPKEINVSGNIDLNHSIEIAAQRVDEIISALSLADGEACDVQEALH